MVAVRRLGRSRSNATSWAALKLPSPQDFPHPSKNSRICGNRNTGKVSWSSFQPDYQIFWYSIPETGNICGGGGGGGKALHPNVALPKSVNSCTGRRADSTRPLEIRSFDHGMESERKQWLDGEKLRLMGKEERRVERE